MIDTLQDLYNHTTSMQCKLHNNQNQNNRTYTLSNLAAQMSSYVETYIG
jgi:hypothetical protein